MVEERERDGRRIAELLAAELDGRTDGDLDRVAVVDADPDADPTRDGTRAYGVAVDGRKVATVFLHPDRARIDFTAGVDAAAAAATEAGLRVRPTPGPPPRTLVFVEDGAQVKRVVPVVVAAAIAAVGSMGDDG